jgi:hypothetical protein
MQLKSLCITFAVVSVAQTVQAQAVDWSICNSGSSCFGRQNTDTSTVSAGVYGISSSARGVLGHTNSGVGVQGDGIVSGTGVKGTSASGNGVHGQSNGLNGVFGVSLNAFASGVYGENQSGGGYGVAGRATSAGVAVMGDNTNSSGWAGVFYGKLYADAAHKPGGGSWTTFSDARLKKDVKPLEGVLERLLKLRGVTFGWVEPEKHGHLVGPQIGMIAQEVEQVFPEWVGTEANGYKTLTIRGFEALAVEGIRAVHKDNQSLRRENQALRHQVETLEERMTKLEERRPDSMAGFGSRALGPLGAVALGLAVFLSSRRRPPSSMP